MRLKRPTREIFDRFLAPARSAYACFRHPWRTCVYDEAEAVIEHQLDDANRVRAQMSFYREMGYPAKAGLAKNGFILRRHNDPHLIPVMERWHQQVLRHSLRDQLSLNPVLWFDQYAVDYLDLDFIDYELLEWPVITDGVRLPRDFDASRYRELHPSITIDPRKHYLLHGAAEQAAYK